MNQREAHEFIDKNADAFKLLSQKIREADTIRNCRNEIDLKAKQKAIEIVEGWITEIFGIAEGELINKTDEESLYIRLVKGRNEPENNF